MSGNKIKQTILLKQGIKQEIAKKISKKIRDQIKKINVSINGEMLRVSSKSKNDLQLAIKLVSGNKVKQTILLKQGIKQEIAKKISKNIRDEIKKINVSINGETLRVSSKSKNDLQLAIKLVSDLEESLNIPLKANNFR